MDRKTRVLVGGTLIIGGAGAIGYAWYRRQQQQSIGNLTAKIVSQPNIGETGLVHVVVTWTNLAKIPITYGVQGAIVQAPPIGPAGLIGGRFFTSESVALQAAQAFDRGDLDTVRQLVNNPKNRVAIVTVQPGKTGEAHFYARPRVVSGERFVFWIRPSPGSRLLVQDEPLRPLEELPQPDTERSV